MKNTEFSEFSLCPKLTRSHINLTPFTKMNVKLAAQTLSRSVANGLDMVHGETVKSTSKFITVMNRWFDVVNVKSLFEGRNERNSNLLPFTSVDDDRLKWLETDFLKYFLDWQEAAEKRTGQFTDKHRKQMQLSSQTLHGLRMTSLSIAAIVRTVIHSGAEFVLTNHINQDPLEQLFGHCRHKGGSNENPSVGEACHAINTIRSVSSQAVFQKGNTEACSTQLDCNPVPKRISHH